MACGTAGVLNINLRGLLEWLVNVKELPMENPSTLEQVRHLLACALLPGLSEVLQPEWEGLPTERGERALAITRLLLNNRERILEHFWGHASGLTHGGSSSQDDRAGLVWWHVDHVLLQDFPDKKVPPDKRCNAPFYLYQLARGLANMSRLQDSQVVKCVHNVVWDLSAEHTCAGLRAYYSDESQAEVSLNHVLKVLRPVSAQRNHVVRLLQSRHQYSDLVTQVVGEPWENQEHAIRRVLNASQALPAQWLMNWTAYVAGQNGRTLALDFLAQTVGDDDSASTDGLPLGTPLSSNKDVYLQDEESTRNKLNRVLQELHQLHG